MENTAANEIYGVPWLPCHIENQKFIIKCIFREASYTILLSDLKCLYSEELDGNSLLMKSKELNSSMEILPQIIIEQLQKMSKSYVKSCHTVSEKLILLKRDPNMIVLKAESLLSGVPFIWHYNLKVMEISAYYLYFVQPMMNMIAELRRHNKALVKIVKEKDEEIHQIKSSSASKFDEETFTTEMDKVMNVTNNTNEIIESVFHDQLFSKIESAFLTTPVSNCTSIKNEPSQKKMCTEETSTPRVSSFSTEDNVTMAEEISRRQQLQEQLDFKKQKSLKKKLIKF